MRGESLDAARPPCENNSMEPFELTMRRGGGAAISALGRFFMKSDPVHETLRRITSRLDELGIAYAVAGGMALAQKQGQRAGLEISIKPCLPRRHAPARAAPDDHLY